MARTFGGLLIYGASKIGIPAAQRGQAASQIDIVRNALGDNSLNNTTVGVATFNLIVNIDEIKRPYFSWPASIGDGTVLLSNENQELFGTAAGGPGNPFSGGQGTTGSQFGTPFIPWGLAVIDVFAIYSVQTAALTTATLALNRAAYVENTAFTNTALLAATGVALTTTTSATTPHVQKVSLAQPLVYEATDNSDLTIEFLVTTAATSALRVYAIGMHVAIEYA